MTTTDSAPEHSAPLSRSFHFFLWTRMLSTAANQILLVSLGWQMYDLTASAWDLGLVGLFQFVPTVLLTLPSGHLADRVDRRRLLAAAIALQLVVAAILAWSSASGWAGREIILGLSIFLGAAPTPQPPAPHAILPNPVETTQLPRAMALSSAVVKIAVVAGPSVGRLVH